MLDACRQANRSTGPWRIIVSSTRSDTGKRILTCAAAINAITSHLISLLAFSAAISYSFKIGVKLYLVVIAAMALLYVHLTQYR